MRKLHVMNGGGYIEGQPRRAGGEDEAVQAMTAPSTGAEIQRRRSGDGGCGCGGACASHQNRRDEAVDAMTAPSTADVIRQRRNGGA